MEMHRTLVCRGGSRELAALGRRIGAWRSGCSGPQGRMPERLWRETVALAAELGCARVASALGLSPRALERRLGSHPAPGPSPARAVFLDVTPAARPSPPARLEVEARGGMRLCLEAPIDALRALVRSVLREAR